MCCLLRGFQKKWRNTIYLTIFGHNEIEKKIPTPIEGEGGEQNQPVEFHFFPPTAEALGSSAIVKVSEQTGAAPKPIPPMFPSKGSQVKVPK